MPRYSVVVWFLFGICADTCDVKFDGGPRGRGVSERDPVAYLWRPKRFCLAMDILLSRGDRWERARAAAGGVASGNVVALFWCLR